MYKYAYQVLIALTLFAGLMVPATQAQSIMLKADIPFDFVVGDKQLHSGEYHVKQTHPGVMLIQSKDARSSAMVLTTAAAGQERSRMSASWFSIATATSTSCPRSGRLRVIRVVELPKSRLGA